MPHDAPEPHECVDCFGELEHHPEEMWEFAAMGVAKSEEVAEAVFDERYRQRHELGQRAAANG